MVLTSRSWLHMAGTEASVPRVAGNWSCSCNIDSRHDIVKSSWKYRLLCCCVTRDVTQSNGLQEGSFIFLFSVSCFDEEVIFFIFWGLFREKQNHTITEECPDCCLAKHEGNQMSGLGEDTFPKSKSQPPCSWPVNGGACSITFVSGQFVVDSGCIAATSQQGLAWEGEGLQDELQAVPGEKKERRTTRRRDGRSSGPCASAPSSSGREPVKKRLQKLEHTGLWLPGKRNKDCHSLRQQQRTWAESEKWRSHHNEEQKTETKKGETSSPAPALHVLRGRGGSITMHIWHIYCQPFHGVTCVLLMRAWFRTSTRQKRALRARMPAVDRQGGGRLSFEGDILADGGSWHTRESSKSIFSTMTTFHVAVNGWPVSTGIRLLWNESLWLESAIFAFFRAERPVWKGTRRKNWQEKYCLCWW